METKIVRALAQEDIRSYLSRSQGIVLYYHQSQRKAIFKRPLFSSSEVKAYYIDLTQKIEGKNVTFEIKLPKLPRSIPLTLEYSAYVIPEVADRFLQKYLSVPSKDLVADITETIRLAITSILEEEPSLGITELASLLQNSDQLGKKIRHSVAEIEFVNLKVACKLNLEKINQPYNFEITQLVTQLKDSLQTVRLDIQFSATALPEKEIIGWLKVQQDEVTLRCKGVILDFFDKNITVGEYVAHFETKVTRQIKTQIQNTIEAEWGLTWGTGRSRGFPDFNIPPKELNISHECDRTIYNKAGHAIKITVRHELLLSLQSMEDLIALGIDRPEEKIKQIINSETAKAFWNVSTLQVFDPIKRMELKEGIGKSVVEEIEKIGYEARHVLLLLDSQFSEVANLNISSENSYFTRTDGVKLELKVVFGGRWDSPLEMMEHYRPDGGLEEIIKNEVELNIQQELYMCEAEDVYFHFDRIETHTDSGEKRDTSIRERIETRVRDILKDYRIVTPQITLIPQNNDLQTFFTDLSRTSHKFTCSFRSFNSMTLGEDINLEITFDITKPNEAGFMTFFNKMKLGREAFLKDLKTHMQERIVAIAKTLHASVLAYSKHAEVAEIRKRLIVPIADQMQHEFGIHVEIRNVDRQLTKNELEEMTRTAELHKLLVNETTSAVVTKVEAIIEEIKTIDKSIREEEELGEFGDEPGKLAELKEKRKALQNERSEIVQRYGIRDRTADTTPKGLPEKFDL